MSLSIPVLGTLLAVVMCMLFEAGYVWPLSASLALFTFIFLWGLLKAGPTPLSFVARLLLLLYALPFIHCYPYLWFDYNPTERMWGMAPNPYQFDPEIISRMAMVGCIGACAYVGGLALLSKPGKDRQSPTQKDATLDILGYVCLAAIALLLSWVNAPVETVFEKQYTFSPSRLGNLRFNGAWMLAYTLLVLLFIDALNETARAARRTKMFVTAVSSTITVLYFQFLRGDRECIGMIFAFVAVYLMDTERLKRGREIAGLHKNRLLMAGCIGVVVFLFAQVIGQIRSQVVERNLLEALAAADYSPDTLMSGTWSGVLLTPLSVIGDFHNGLMEPRWGSTYWDYLLSIPPGPVAQFFGYERPIESTHGPAWEMRYGIGGTHALVVPFMNFKTYGVWAVLLLYGVLVARLERWVASERNVKARLLYGSIAVGAPFWFWFGEMNAVRMLMAFYCVWFLYLIMPKSSRMRAASALSFRCLPERPLPPP